MYYSYYTVYYSAARMKNFSFENNLRRDFVAVPCSKESSVLVEM